METASPEPEAEEPGEEVDGGALATSQATWDPGEKAGDESPPAAPAWESPPILAPPTSSLLEGIVPDPAVANTPGAPATPALATPAGPPHAAPPAPPTPVHQLAEALRGATNERTELRLDPAELGRLRFEITQRGEVPLVVLAAERPETADLLRRHLPELQAEFRAMGFAGAEFSFAGWDGSREGQAAGQPASSADTPTAAPAGRATPDAPATQKPLRAAPPAGGLDLRL